MSRASPSAPWRGEAGSHKPRLCPGGRSSGLSSPDEQELPPYRKLGAQYFANFMNSAWKANEQPFFWPVLGKEAYEKMNPFEFRDGVAKVQALSVGATIQRPELGLLVQGKMFPD